MLGHGQPRLANRLTSFENFSNKNPFDHTLSHVSGTMNLAMKTTQLHQKMAPFDSYVRQISDRIDQP